MDETNDSTAVVRIRGNFLNFISGSSATTTNKRLDFDYGAGSYESVNKERYANQSELISTKMEISRLQLQLKTAETKQKELEITHESEMEKMKTEHQRDISKFLDLRSQYVVIAKKDAERKQELMQTKLELKKATEFQKFFVIAQKEKIALEAELEQVKSDSKDNVERLTFEKRSLSESLQLTMSQLKDQESLHATIRSNNEKMLQIATETENLRSQLATANMRIKELELAFSRVEEDEKIVIATKTQLNQFRQFEKENKSLKEENQYLNAIQKNTYLLTEENNDLHAKLEQAEQKIATLLKFEVLCEDLQKQVSRWQNIDEHRIMKTPAQMRQYNSDLQREVEQLLEKNGQIEARNHSLEEFQSSNSVQLQKKLTTNETKLQEAIDLIARLKKKLVFVSKEKEQYKNCLDLYYNHDDELTVTSDARTKDRIKQLERSLESYQKHIAGLEGDLEKSVTQVTHFRQTVSRLEQEMLQQREKMSVAMAATNPSDTNIVLGLRQKVVDLEKRIEKVVEEKEEALAQLERVDQQGGYDRTKTRVVHFRMNPYSTSHQRQSEELDRLRDENIRLKAKMKVLEEAGGPVEGLSTMVDENMCPAEATKTIEEMKLQLASEQLKNQRLMEAFQKTSQELREVCVKVLGYRIEIPAMNQFRLMNIYAETRNDFFLFKQSQGGELQLLANEYSESFQDQVETYLRGGNSLPAFMSSVTLELFGRQTVMQTD